MFAGLVIGLWGPLLGALIGYGAVMLITKTGIISLPKDVYQVSHLPLSITGLDILSIMPYGARHQLPRNALSVVAGGEAGSCRSAEVRVNESESPISSCRSCYPSRSDFRGGNRG